MFKNRQLTVKLNKVNEDETSMTISNGKTFEEKTAIIKQTLEGLGKKMFIGVCVYVVLDTHRQVAIVKANNPIR
jgi:hypothetical protein